METGADDTQRPATSLAVRRASVAAKYHMLISDLLTESFPYPPGSVMPPNITDYRDPEKASGKYRRYGNGYRDNKGSRRFWSKRPRTHVVLAKNGGVIVFYYSDYNTVPWPELTTLLHKEIDPVQTDIFDIVVKGTGYLLDRTRETGGWSGDRTRYSSDMVEIVRALYERGAATPSMPIWLGNWAAEKGEHIGTVRDVLANGDDDLRYIVLYHGTDSLRLSQIMKSGLKPVESDTRVWNRTSLDKSPPAHRDLSIYLTASPPQAQYYASKAVNIDRKRFGPTKRREAARAFEKADRLWSQMTSELASYETMTPQQIADRDAHAKHYDYQASTIAQKQSFYPEMIAKLRATLDDDQKYIAHDFYGEIEPVILQIRLNKSEFSKLMADDDFLRQNPKADPTDWRESLSLFGQIAFKGTIPPNRIKVLAQGKIDRLR